MSVETGQINPVEVLVNLPKGADLRDPAVAKAVTCAMEKLGYCDDTMALLTQKLGLAGPNVTYKEIRSQFPHGREG